jgi:hypothetical protein
MSPTKMRPTILGSPGRQCLGAELSPGVGLSCQGPPFSALCAFSAERRAHRPKSTSIAGTDKSAGQPLSAGMKLVPSEATSPRRQELPKSQSGTSAPASKAQNKSKLGNAGKVVLESCRGSSKPERLIEKTRLNKTGSAVLKWRQVVREGCEEFVEAAKV